MLLHLTPAHLGSFIYANHSCNHSFSHSFLSPSFKTCLPQGYVQSWLAPTIRSCSGWQHPSSNVCWCALNQPEQLPANLRNYDQGLDRAKASQAAFHQPCVLNVLPSWAFQTLVEICRWAGPIFPADEIIVLRSPSVQPQKNVDTRIILTASHACQGVSNFHLYTVKQIEQSNITTVLLCTCLRTC